MSKEIEELQEFLNEALENKTSLEVLEAGCGSSSRLRWPPSTKIIGIDISEEELQKNSAVTEKILGDIQTYRLPQGRFDVIVCWDVLEHLQKPTLALDRFREGAAVGGLIVIAFPNVHSVKGLVAKATPLWFHEFVYRRIYGSRYGQPGLENFPTYLRWTISPSRIRKYALENGLDVTFFKLRESGVQRRFRAKIRMTGRIFSAIEGIVRVLSLGTVTFRNSDCVFVLRKNK